jgi:hypothetical protein
MHGTLASLLVECARRERDLYKSDEVGRESLVKKLFSDSDDFRMDLSVEATQAPLSTSAR